MSEKVAVSYFVDAGHVCMKHLAEVESPVAKVVLDASMAAFATSVEAFIRGMSIARAMMGEERTSEDRIVEALAHTMCNDCLEYWINQHCCGHHAIDGVIQGIADSTDSMSTGQDPAAAPLPFDPSLN